MLELNYKIFKKNFVRENKKIFLIIFFFVLKKNKKLELKIIYNPLTSSFRSSFIFSTFQFSHKKKIKIKKKNKTKEHKKHYH